jgi:hypothetical protein
VRAAEFVAKSEARPKHFEHPHAQVNLVTLCREVLSDVGEWTRSLETQGNRIRIFQNRRAAAFHRAVWLSGIWDILSLPLKQANGVDETEAA